MALRSGVASADLTTQNAFWVRLSVALLRSQAWRVFAGVGGSGLDARASRAANCSAMPIVNASRKSASVMCSNSGRQNGSGDAVRSGLVTLPLNPMGALQGSTRNVLRH